MLDILRPITICNQDGIRGVDDNKIADANGTNDALITLNVTVVYIEQQRFAFDAVTFFICCGKITQCVPGSNVTPAYAAWHDSNIAGCFHYGVVNRVVRYLIKGSWVEFNLCKTFTLSLARLPHTGAHGCQDFRTMLFHLTQHRSSRKAEHARIPKITA